MSRTYYKNLDITVRYFGGSPAPFDKENRNYHEITIRNQRTNSSRKFQYWSSIAHPKVKERKDILSALECILADAISGSLSFSCWCSDLGMNPDSLEAFGIYRATERTYSDMLYIIGSYDSMQEMYNDLISQGL
jgi:hypothetical protein